MRCFFFITGFILILNCASNSYIVTSKGKTISVYFIEPELTRDGLIKDKTEFYLFRDSKGSIVPGQDSTKSEYLILLRIHSRPSNLMEPEKRLYEAIVHLKSVSDGSLIGMAEARAEGEFNQILSSLSKNLSKGLISIFKKLPEDENK